MKTVEERVGHHTSLSGELNFQQFELEIFGVCVEFVALDYERTGSAGRRAGGFSRLIDFQRQRTGKRSPCAGHWTKSADEIVDSFGRLIPID